MGCTSSWLKSQYHVARHGETGRCAIAFVDRCQFSLGFPGLAARAAGPNRRESIVRVPSCAHLCLFVQRFGLSLSRSHDLCLSTGTMGPLESTLLVLHALPSLHALHPMPALPRPACPACHTCSRWKQAFTCFYMLRLSGGRISLDFNRRRADS